MHPAWILTFFISVIVLLIVYFVVRKTGSVTIGLCEQHEKRRKTGVALTWLFSLAGIMAFILGMMFATDRKMDEFGPPLLIACPVLLIAALISGMGFARTVYPSKMDQHFIWLAGVKAPLTSLPWQQRNP
jgi:hypothetical protein